MSDAAFLKCQCAHCGGRIEFPANALNRTIPCPHCQRETLLTVPVEAPATESPIAPAEPAPKRSSMKSMAIGVGAVVLIGAIVTGALLLKKRGPESAPQSLQVVGWKMEPGEYRTFYLTGAVTNASDKAYNGVAVEFELFDNLGQSVGTISDQTPTLEPHGAWKFKLTTSPTQSVWEAKVKGVRLVNR